MKALTKEQVDKLAEPTNYAIDYIYELVRTEKPVARDPKDTKDMIKVAISDQRLDAAIKCLTMIKYEGNELVSDVIRRKDVYAEIEDWLKLMRYYHANEDEISYAMPIDELRARIARIEIYKEVEQ